MTHGKTGASGATVLFRDMVAQSRLAMVASDLSKPDRPLVFVNDAFVTMTGFSREASIGRNCRFLQGPDTDPETVRAIRETIAQGEDGYFELLNYRHDGTRFWNGLHIGPLDDAEGRPTLYFGAQRDVTREREARDAEALRAREIAHRMGNLLAIVTTMVRSSARGEGEEALRSALEQRLLALARSNALVTPVPNVDADMTTRVPVATVLRTVLEPIALPARVALEGPAVDLVASDVANVALVVHELATNALKHGALSNEAGRVALSWRDAGERIEIDWLETGGPPYAAGPRRGMGTRLLTAIARGSHRADAGIRGTADGMSFRFDARGG